MYFIDDVNLEPGRLWRVPHIFDNLANVVHRGAAGGIHFKHIRVARFGNFQAVFTLAARAGGHILAFFDVEAIKGAGQKPGGGGFAHSAYPGQDKGVGQALGHNGIFQGFDHDILADKLVKRFGPVFAG